MLGLLCLAAVAGCAGNRSLNTGEAALDPDRPRPAETWERDLGRALASSPVALPDGWLAAETGRGLWRLGREGGEVWRRKLPASPTQAPAVCESTVVIGVDVPGNEVVGLALADGESRWKHRFAVPLCAGRDSFLVVAARGGAVARLAPADGAVRWRAHLPGAGWRAPALRVAEDLVLVPIRPDSLAALRLSTGVEAWRVRIGPWPRVSAEEGAILAVADDSTLARIDPADGSARARRRLAGMAAGVPVTAGDRAVLAIRDGTVLAVRSADLGTIWSRPLEAPLVAAPWVGGGEVVQPGPRGDLYRMSLADGAPRGRFRHPEFLISSPAGERDLVAQGGARGTLVVYRRTP